MNKKPCLILPVIHYLDFHLTLSEEIKAFEAGADGVFLISHHGQDDALFMPASVIKERHPDKLVGVNLLASSNLQAVDFAQAANADMVWLDVPGVTSAGATDGAYALSAAASSSAKSLAVFGSVAFKYQPEDSNPPLAAIYATALGMIPTTSGSATGSPPTVEKIRSMREALGPDAPLAVASGMTPENVADYAPYLTHILVSTGVSLDEYRIDPVKLASFIKVVRQVASC